ncbi:Hypothetical protein CINCED_3A025741 [Cinara cedri]|uniref:Uncharacterized protein n=1 Tax=Cinara cedri TaxID=506608 RepID=A0A5E4MNZ8_9HEMI|nr:Hypothetical protein CINCED_3A025741 [Cinara cedri]
MSLNLKDDKMKLLRASNITEDEKALILHCYKSETTLKKLQIDYQKILIENLLAKRREENELYKLKKEKLLLKINKMKKLD